MILFSAKKFFFLFLFAAPVLHAESNCTPFKVHMKVHLPAAPKFSDSIETESSLLSKIGRLETQSEFPQIYLNWLASHGDEMTARERKDWLQCLYHYAKMDTNQNGIPDWGIIVDQKPAHVLFPKDPDQDGDGVPNVLDEDPLNAKIKTKISSNQIPAHLKISRKEAGRLQEKLFKEFKLIAIDHTDQHSPLVLEQLLNVLRNGFPKGFRLSNLRYIYAFAGHDPLQNIAAYHLEAKALSISGISSYTPLSDTNEVVSALIHEIGHAILFERISAQELSRASVQFAGWNPIEPSVNSFYAIDFFQPYLHPTRKNIVSQYSMKNRHEWFAESFAASIMKKLNRLGSLNGKKVYASPHYTSISTDFEQWLNRITVVK